MTKNLTRNFTLSEFTKSYQASKHGIVNKPDEHQIEALRNLCQQVLQPLRDFYGDSIFVSSGYRCKTLNSIVGGVANSQHLKGEAADLLFPTLAIAIDWMHFIVHNCNFDQLLLERNHRTGAQWLHVSCCQNKSRNRHQVKLLQV